MEHITIRVLIGAALLALAVFCVFKGATSRPHKLKKQPVLITFRKSIPHELEEKIEIMHGSRIELLFSFLLTLFVIWSYLQYIWNHGELLYVIAPLPGVLATAWHGSHDVVFYENAIVHKYLLGKKIYFLDEIDAISTYNVTNSFNRGVSYGYRLVCGEETLLDLPKGRFKKIDSIENIYRNSKYIEDFLTGE